MSDVEIMPAKKWRTNYESLIARIGRDFLLSIAHTYIAWKWLHLPRWTSLGSPAHRERVLKIHQSRVSCRFERSHRGSVETREHDFLIVYCTDRNIANVPVLVRKIAVRPANLQRRTKIALRDLSARCTSRLRATREQSRTGLIREMRGERAICDKELWSRSIAVWAVSF